MYPTRFRDAATILLALVSRRMQNFAETLERQNA
jgi:hypothetical protein